MTILRVKPSLGKNMNCVHRHASTSRYLINLILVMECPQNVHGDEGRSIRRILKAEKEMNWTIVVSTEQCSEYQNSQNPSLV